VSQDTNGGSLPTWIETYVPRWLRPRPLTSSRIAAAFAIAVVVDALQLLFGPAGWMVADEVMDVVAMVATSRLLGFHPLLLPTFALEILPVANVLPSWTGCVGVVVALRRRDDRRAAPEEPLGGNGRSGS